MGMDMSIEDGGTVDGFRLKEIGEKGSVLVTYKLYDSGVGMYEAMFYPATTYIKGIGTTREEAIKYLLDALEYHYIEEDNTSSFSVVDTDIRPIQVQDRDDGIHLTSSYLGIYVEFRDKVQGCSVVTPLLIKGALEVQENYNFYGVNFLSNNNKAVVAYSKEKKPVGVISYKEYREDKELSIALAYIVPEYRKRGIYTLLYNEIVNKYQKLGYTEIYHRVIKPDLKLKVR